MTTAKDQDSQARQWANQPQQQQQQNHSQAGPQRRSRQRRRIWARPLSPDIPTEGDVILGPCWRCGSRQHLRAYCPSSATTTSPTRRATGIPTTASTAATTPFCQQEAAAAPTARQSQYGAAAPRLPARPEIRPEVAPEEEQILAMQRTRWAQLQAKLATATQAQAARRLEEAQQLEQDMLVQVAKCLLL